MLGSKIPGEPWRVDGYKLETRYRPWTQNYFFVPTFYLEYEQFHHHEVYRNAVAGNVEEGGEVEAFRTEHEVGLTRNSPNSGVFLYLSWEAPVWKPR